MSQQLVVKPQGIISEPNKVGQFPPGAFASCSNGVMRSFGCLEQVQKWSTSYSLPGLPVGGGYALSNRNLTVFILELGSVGQWYAVYYWLNESTGTVTTGSASLGGYANPFVTSDQRTGILLMRNRLIVTGTFTSFALDFVSNSSGGLAAVLGPRYCGVEQPAISNRTFSTTAEADGGVLGPNKHMSALTVSRLVFSDGYELASPPSMLWDFPNLSSTVTQIPSVWSLYTQYPVSFNPTYHKAYSDVYRTREQSVGYDNVNNKYIPIATGSSFYLSSTAPSVTGGGNTFITDGTLPSGLGEALLTNVAVGGATALPFPPVPSKTCAEFRGHAFYANRVDPATVTLLNPYFWGVIPQTAPTAISTYGVGLRVFTGAAAGSGNPTVSGLAHTIGVVAGQKLTYRRTDTGATVMTGTVLSKTGTTITSTVVSSYTGSVSVETEDMVEVSSPLSGPAITIPAGTSASDFALNLTNYGFTHFMDVTCVALEPQISIPGAGIYPGFAPTGGLRIRFRTSNNLTLRATNGDNYSPKLPGISSTVLTITATRQPNGYAWSENNEPENCPPSNYAFAGSGDIYKIIATRDCLWFFCSDGLFRLSGNGGSVAEGYDWVLDPVDPKLIIHNPNCAVVHREYVYAYTNRGLVSISSEGVVRELSDGRLNPTSADTTGKLPNRGWEYKTNNAADDTTVWMAADSLNDEIWLRTGFWETNPKQIWVYNTKTDAFTTLRPSLYSPIEVPTLGIFSQGEGEILTVFSGRGNLHRPSNFNGTNQFSDYEELACTLQPLYGSGSAAAHTMKHWQDLQFSFKTPLPYGSLLLTIRGASNTGLGAQVSRFVPPTTAQPNGEASRTGVVIPRNFPAMSNACSFTFFIGATTAATSPATLEGISVNYINFATQRRER